MAMPEFLIRESILKAADELGNPTLKLEVVTAFVKGRDVFGILPTGFGKSLCYNCLPATFDILSDKGTQL